MGFHQTMAYLMGLIGQLVMVYVGPAGNDRNVALLTGVLEKGAEWGRQKRPPVGHLDFREGNIFFWVRGHVGLNGFFIGEDVFRSAELSDEGTLGVELHDGIGLIVKPLKSDSPEASILE